MIIMRFMQQMAGKDEGTSLEDSSFGPGHFIGDCDRALTVGWLKAQQMANNSEIKKGKNKH